MLYHRAREGTSLIGIPCAAKSQRQLTAETAIFWNQFRRDSTMTRRIYVLAQARCTRCSNPVSQASMGAEAAHRLFDEQLHLGNSIADILGSVFVLHGVCHF